MQNSLLGVGRSAATHGIQKPLFKLQGPNTQTWIVVHCCYPHDGIIEDTVSSLSGSMVLFAEARMGGSRHK